MFRAEFCGMMTRKKEGTDMKVLMLNGSCNERGCTYTALEEIGRTLREEGVDCEIFQLGARLHRLRRLRGRQLRLHG